MTYEFWIMASITELVEYPDETCDECIPHPNFQAIMDVLDIKVPIKDIHERFLDQSIHTGDVLVFANQHQQERCIVLDTYRDPYDQLDMIQFGWKMGTKEAISIVKQLSRRLYDNCEFAVCYKEGQSVLYKVLQEESYPREYSYKKTVYEQQIKKYVL